MQALTKVMTSLEDGMWMVDFTIMKLLTIKNQTNIKELRYIDPRKIKKVRETKKEKSKRIECNKKTVDYYVYNEKGMMTTQGIRISPDAITYCPSGLVDANKNHVLSYLHKAIKPVNQLRMIEDSLIVTEFQERRKEEF